MTVNTDVKVEEKKEIVNVQTSENQTESAEAAQDKNWKAFREAKEADRKARLEAERMANEERARADALKAAMEALVNRPNPTNDISPEETEEGRITRLVRENLEKQKKYEDSERVKREQTELPQRLAQTFPDFQQVCSEENLMYLEYHHPELAKALDARQNNFDKWSDVYHAMKRYVNNPNSKKDQAKAQQNGNKPQSMSVPGATQTGDQAPQKLDDKRKSDNWLRMQRRMKGLA